MQVVVGTRGCVFEHMQDVMKKLGFEPPRARRVTREIAIHSAKEAAHILGTYAKLTMEDKTGIG